MGTIIKFKHPVLIAIDNKVCSFDGTGGTTHVIAADNKAAKELCKKVNESKDKL